MGLLSSETDHGDSKDLLQMVKKENIAKELQYME